MIATLVYIHVKDEFIEDFIVETRKNVSASLMEAGIARFDFIQQAEDHSRFILIEVYKNLDAPALHKQTAHYNIWREVVQGMMAEPRQGIKFDWLAPEL